MKITLKIEEYADRDMLCVDLAGKLASELESTLFHEDGAVLAVPGGTTPGPVFDVLSAVSHLDWSRIKVMLSDERWVPEDSPRSNTALIKSRLMTGPAAAAEFLPFYGDGPIAETVLRLGDAVGQHLPISVLLLGMGADMHTASLFPGAPGLDAALSANAPVLSIVEPEGEPEMRVSLSAHVLEGALSKHLIIFGAEKRVALERAMELPPEQAPIRAVMTDLMVHWAE